MQNTFGDRQPPAPSHRDVDAVLRRPTGGTASHHLVAHLSSGLRSAYAAEPETEVTDVFAALIARLASAEAAAAAG